MTEAAKFLKSTLRLPSSKFPARPSPAEVKKYLSRCTDDLYAWQRQSRPAKDTFVLHDGPPYANGDLHVGHALNKIIKDIICRTKLAKGKRIDYTPGWDCHGLPIELKALEKNGWKRGGVDAVAIRKAARKFAYDTIKTQMKGFKSWGVMGDWKNHWKTMDKDFELGQLRVFKAMAERGLIYRKNKPVYWSPSSGTALAEAEVDYKEDHISTAALIKFPLQDNLNVVIWTTTPWTIPANQAIAINKSIEYSICSSSHGKLVIATSRMSYMEEQLGEKLTKISNISAEDLLTRTYLASDLLTKTHSTSDLTHLTSDLTHSTSDLTHSTSDLTYSNRPIIHADFVKEDSGTGLVHCAPGHGHDDYLALQPLIKTGRVQVIAPVDDQGRFTSAAGSDLTGLYVYKEGNEKIINILKQNKTLLSSYKFKHKYPIDWRTKEPVMIRATAQWFADVSTIKEATLKSLETVSFKPETGASRLKSFVENRSEWCISRQRSWGVPIPALYHKETGEALLTAESIEHIINTIQERGIDAWWSDDAEEPAWIPSGLTNYIRGTDTMDVWFDSGTSWTINKTADVYLEGSDQHRGWFQSSLLTSIAYQTSISSDQPQAPFRTLVTHGFTLDANERKMSKSEGNVVAPDQIIQGFTQSKKGHEHGPDALRLWAASSDWTKDVVISEKVVTTVHNNLDKYRITFKLLLGMLQDFNPQTILPYNDINQTDRIALLQLYKVVSSIQDAYQNFEFHKAITIINKWMVTDLSGFYFEAIKDVIYCDSPSGIRRKSAQTTLHHIFNQLQSILGSITPLLVEETFEFSPKSIQTVGHPLQKIWKQPPSEWNTDINITQIMAINSSVKIAQEKARAEKLIGSSLASEVLIWLETDCEFTESTLKEILVVSKVSILNTPEPEPTNSWRYQQEFPSGFVIVQSPSQNKCTRCWKYEAAKELCQRCEEVVKEYRLQCFGSM